MSDCIVWTKARISTGYGSKWVDGRSQLVHRLTWEEANGPIPEGMEIMHICDNPPCYNLDHLRLGTRSDNMQDMVSKDRRIHASTLKTHCPAGHEFSADNTRIARGKRVCRACDREYHSRTYIPRKKEDSP